MSGVSLESEPVDCSFPLVARDWVINYHSKGQVIRAVDGVSFRLQKAKTLGLVGESGSGKSSIAKALVKLIPLHSGDYYIDDEQVDALSNIGFFPFRKKIQLIFQDPYQSLNPSISLEQILAEPQRIHFPERKQNQRKETSISLLEQVGLQADDLTKFPSQFSGGQRQRIVIARALAVEPEILICDEPVSALDVSIQAQILNLLKDLQDSHDLSMLFISHDLAVVDFMADQIAVMKTGKFVEEGQAQEIYENPQHPYTQSLLEASPGWN